MIQFILKYLGWDDETKRMRAEARQNLAMAGTQLLQLQRRLEETSKISSAGRKALRKTLSESISGEPRRAAGG